MDIDWLKLTAVVMLALALTTGGLAACRQQEGESGLNTGPSPSESIDVNEGALEDSGASPDAQAGEGGSGSRSAENAEGNSSDRYPTADELLIIEERAPIPDTWVVEEFGKMADRQRKLVVNAVDDETYQLLVEEYGEEEVARYRDDESE